MEQQKSTSSNTEILEAISRFLASPPKGTPAAVIDAFTVSGAREFLPPKLFHETVEQAPVSISITDPGAKILYVNAAFEQLTGYSREEVVGKNQSVLSSHSTPASVYQELWNTIRERRVWKGALVNHRKDKEEYLAELTVSPVLDGTGQIAYYLGMHRDISEVHQLEQRLKFQRILTETALESAPMVVAMLTMQGGVLFDNHAYKALRGSFQGREPADVFLAAVKEINGFELGELNQNSGAFRNIEIRLDASDNSTPRWFVCSGVRVEAPDEAAQNYFKRNSAPDCCLLLIANEVTAERKRTNEARLNMIRANMAEQQMLQTMREAMLGAEFKLQVPLNIIRAALAMPGLQNETGNLRYVLQQALDSGDEAMQTLNAAIPAPLVEQVSAVNINEILHDVIKLSTPRLLAGGIVVDWRPTTVLPTVQGRENELRGLFKYLLDNAVQALRESNKDEREIRLETSLEKQELLICMTDNGPGVPKNQRLKIFEPFFCAWTQAKGHAGMGLPMAQEIVNAHDGGIEIDSAFYGGCRIIVRLPIDSEKGS